MKKIYSILLCVGLIAGFVSCEQDRDFRLTTLTLTSETITPSYESAEVSCVLKAGATISEVYVHYSPTSSFADYKEVEMTNENGTYIAQLTDLHKNTMYYIRYGASNKYSSAVTKKNSSFHTLDFSLPVLTTTSVTQVTTNSAVTGGNVTDDGGLSVTERGVVYGTSPNPTTSDNKITNGTGKGSYTCNLTDLQEGTTYYVRAYAVNEKGTAYGEEVSFITNKTVVVPTVTTTAVTQVTETTAVTGGNVTDDGGASVTERGVVYGISPNPTTSDNKITNGSGEGLFTCNLTGLQAITTYYVRAYAVNEKGTAYGEEISFTTAAPAVPEYVDLGLSVKWATFNVGANYGDWFAWGETEPKMSYSESNYSYTDNPTTLPLSADAARVNWGGNWRMPTDVEWTELREQCTWTWTAQNGVNGYKVTSKKNGNSIFLPAAGHSRYDCPDDFTGIDGYYWSSSLDTDGPFYAWSVTFNSSGVYRGGLNRYYGYSVRPVYGDPVEIESILPTVTTTAVTQVTETTAVTGGNVTADGNATVTERGVIYSTTQNPTTSNSKKVSGSGIGSFTCNLTGLQANTTYYIRAYAINSKGVAYGEEMSFTTKSPSSSDHTGTENGHEYVDLGLSVKWATCNVGANKPEDYGDYFAWGETEPKTTYDWSTYKWCNGSDMTLTKYNTNSDYGIVDNKTTLELSDDAAQVNWGGSWRIPTDAELLELRDQCTWTWTIQNGVKGYKVTSKKNGNSIFLPAAGYRRDSSLYYAGSLGYYWSSSLHAYYTSDAYCLYFNSSLVDWGNSSRDNNGHSVRPVCQ